jgi:hypothetical protein
LCLLLQTVRIETGVQSFSCAAWCTRPAGRVRSGVLWLLARAGLFSLVFLFLSTLARGAAVSEAELKAAYLFNFAKFVEWPVDAFESETAPIQIAIFGDEDFATRLRALLSDKKAHGRSFEVKRISSAQEAKTFQIAFISSSETKRAPQILDATRKSPVLTIGESEQFLELGGMINFVFEDTQLRFDINPDVAEKVKVVISSKLLRLARRVKKGAKIE